MTTFLKERKAALGAIVSFVLALGVMVPTSKALAGDITLYNWFGSNFSFDTTLRGETRWFDLDNIGCEFTAYTDSGTGMSDELDFFNISLNRDYGVFSTGCGTYSAPRNGYSHFDWYNVGSGDYFFYFSKAFDGQTVKCDAMGIFSW